MIFIFNNKNHYNEEKIDILKDRKDIEILRKGEKFIKRKYREDLIKINIKNLAKGIINTEIRP